jgi:hypothetical protein
VRQVRCKLTFVLDELMQEARLSRVRVSNHQELEEEVWAREREIERYKLSASDSSRCRVCLTHTHTHTQRPSHGNQPADAYSRVYALEGLMGMVMAVAELPKACPSTERRARGDGPKWPQKQRCLNHQSIRDLVGLCAQGDDRQKQPQTHRRRKYDSLHRHRGCARRRPPGQPMGGCGAQSWEGVVSLSPRHVGCAS